MRTVQSGLSAAQLRGIRAGSAYDARGRSSHNPPVVGSSPTRPTSSFNTLYRFRTRCGLVSCDSALSARWGEIAVRVGPSAVFDHGPGVRLAVPARPQAGVQGRGDPGAAASSDGAAAAWWLGPGRSGPTVRSWRRWPGCCQPRCVALGWSRQEPCWPGTAV